MTDDVIRTFIEETGLEVDYDTYGNVIYIHPTTDGQWAYTKGRLVQYLEDRNIRYVIG